jgi:serine/threonine-protein kinase
MLLDIAGRMARPEPLPLVGPGEVGAAPMPGESDRVAPTVFPSQPVSPAPRPVRRRRRWTGVLLTGLLIVVAAVGGMLVREISRPTQRALPTLVGSSGDSARSLLTELGWLVERFDVRRNGTSAGEVLDMQPPAGTRLAAGETVVLEVSLGSERQSIPPGLVGVSLSEASRLLVDAGLVTGEVTRVNNEDVVAGVVLEVLRSGDTVPRGDAVDLLVSDGPLPRVVPQGLVGMMPADVVAELIALRLAPTMGEEHDEWVAAGRVSRVEPVAGTRMVVGDDVRVVISLGAAERAVPALEGLSLAAAESRLQVSGFRNVVVVGLPESTDGTPVDRAALVVVSQDPPPARRGMPDVEVTLVVGSG